MPKPQPRAARQLPDRGASLPDPLDQYSAFLHRGFGHYLKWYFRRHFHAVLVAAAGLPSAAADKPLVIYSNHPSWWDPVLFILIGNTLFPGRRGYGPMEARALERYPILRRLGAFGIDLGSARGGITFMVQAKRILANRNSILWLTAEGAFTDVRRRPVVLQPGLGYLARVATGAIVMPLAIEYPFWNESRPVALCRFGDPIDVGPADAGARTAAEWNEFFERALSRTMDLLSYDSMQRSPMLFRSLLDGSSGVGGIYDVWRRLRTWSRGRRFDASHEQPK